MKVKAITAAAISQEIDRMADDGDDLSVNRLSWRVSRSRQYIAKIFYAATGRLLSAVLKERRMRRAAALMRQPAARVSEVATRCGYASVNYFSTEFRKAHGMTPRAFRAAGHPAAG